MFDKDVKLLVIKLHIFTISNLSRLMLVLLCVDVPWPCFIKSTNTDVFSKYSVRALKSLDMPMTSYY
jgi:hypothetical protein